MIEVLLLAFNFFNIGMVGFGGGYAMMSIIFDQCEKLGITAAQFADLAALDLVVPGPLAINAATYVGFLTHGFMGALAATIAISIPSFIIITAVMAFMDKFKQSHWLNDFLLGVKPAAVGLIAAAAIIIGKSVLFFKGASMNAILLAPFESVRIWAVVIFLFVAVAAIKYKVNPILLTLLAGITGAFLL